MPRARKPSLPNPSNNRGDLLTPKGPETTAPDQAYGNRTAQEQSMKILPIGTPATAATPAPTGAAGGPTQPQSAPAGGPLGPAAGELPWKAEAGSGQPLTHGLPFGPGAGPEVLQGAGQQWHAMQQTGEQGTLRSVLTHLASQPQSSSIIRSLASVAGQ